MQNVHAMRPEVRAEFEAALHAVDGNAAFHVRLERFFTELRDLLVALYGSDARFGTAWNTLLRAIASAATARSSELRLLDHEREITPDWLQREQAIGYVAYCTFPDRTEPDAYESTLRGVFPDTAPASFTLVDGRWVWTTFNAFQYVKGANSRIASQAASR